MGTETALYILFFVSITIGLGVLMVFFRTLNRLTEAIDKSIDDIQRAIYRTSDDITEAIYRRADHITKALDRMADKDEQTKPRNGRSGC